MVSKINKVMGDFNHIVKDDMLYGQDDNVCTNVERVAWNKQITTKSLPQNCASDSMVATLAKFLTLNIS